MKIITILLIGLVTLNLLFSISMAAPTITINIDAGNVIGEFDAKVLGLYWWNAPVLCNEKVEMVLPQEFLVICGSLSGPNCGPNLGGLNAYLRTCERC